MYIGGIQISTVCWGLGRGGLLKIGVLRDPVGMEGFYGGCRAPAWVR